MLRKSLILFTLLFSIFVTGCATVPMASLEEDQLKKQFSPPVSETAGLYIYRNSNFGASLKKTVSVDGEVLGETAPMTFFYKDITPGTHNIATESEFSDNVLVLDAESGKNYFVKQNIKLGVFVGGANLELMANEEGEKGVLECKMAK